MASTPRPVLPTASRKAVPQGYGRETRVYVVGDAEYPSVTSVLSVLAKPALVNWAAKTERVMAVEAAANLYEDLPERGKKMSRTAYITTLDARIGKQKAYAKELEKAQTIGSQAHALVEWSVRKATGAYPGPEPHGSPGARRAFEKFETWRQGVELRPMAIEQVVWSARHEYAGTMDLWASARVPGECEEVDLVLDWKTGKAIYDEALVQVVAYARALEEMGHAPGPIWGGIVRLPKLESDAEAEVRLIPPAEQDELFDAFLAAKVLWDWQQRRKSGAESRG